ncbi:MAG: hypothetical protein NC302_05985 [Bacteroidales bacterium]|nr:hypothetical protein [Bacteroidales bacterium]MCM1423989.1 hypothetical protein [bacterium]
MAGMRENFYEQLKQYTKYRAGESLGWEAYEQNGVYDMIQKMPQTKKYFEQMKITRFL